MSRTCTPVLVGVVWSHPFQVEREEGSGDTAIPNAFCWNAIISIASRAYHVHYATLSSVLSLLLSKITVVTV